MDWTIAENDLTGIVNLYKANLITYGEAREMLGLSVPEKINDKNIYGVVQIEIDGIKIVQEDKLPSMILFGNKEACRSIIASFEKLINQKEELERRLGDFNLFSFNMKGGPNG